MGQQRDGGTRERERDVGTTERERDGGTTDRERETARERLHAGGKQSIYTYRLPDGLTGRSRPSCAVVFVTLQPGRCLLVTQTNGGGDTRRKAYGSAAWKIAGGGVEGGQLEGEAWRYSHDLEHSQNKQVILSLAGKRNRGRRVGGRRCVCVC